jgi:DNA invertase Pin-like site-specific DNA recombinase
MSIVGYARVSTAQQSLDIQLSALKKAKCKKIFSEKASSNTKKGREKLQECLNYLREGDTLVITRVDRLARSILDLQKISKQLERSGIKLKATEQPIDTSTAAGKAFFDMLGVFAEFETNIRKERQQEGIEKAKRAGKYKGRKPTAREKTDQVMKMLEAGHNKKDIANDLNIGIASIYRIIKDNNPIDNKQPKKNKNLKRPLTTKNKNTPVTLEAGKIAQGIIDELYSDGSIPHVNKLRVKYLWRDKKGELQRWTGRGRRPAWLNKFLQTGEDLKDIRLRYKPK